MDLVHLDQRSYHTGDDEENIKGRKRRRSFCSQSPGQPFDEKLWTMSHDTLLHSDAEAESERSKTSEYTSRESQPKLLVDCYGKCNANLGSATGV